MLDIHGSTFIIKYIMIGVPQARGDRLWSRDLGPSHRIGLGRMGNCTLMLEIQIEDDMYRDGYGSNCFYTSLLGGGLLL